MEFTTIHKCTQPASTQHSSLSPPMHKAIESGDVVAVQKWLREEGTKVNKCRGGRASNGHFFVGDGTALHWAAYYGQLEITTLLIGKGAGMFQLLVGC